MTTRHATEIDEAIQLLPRAPALIAQCVEWADTGVRGQDPGKIHVRGGDRTDPTARAALAAQAQDRTDPWLQTAKRIEIASMTLRVDDVSPAAISGPAWNALRRAAARAITDAAALIDARTPAPNDREAAALTTRLTDENSTKGPCQWCGRECRGARTPGPDGRTIDDRRRRVQLSDRWSIGLCNACHAALLRAAKEEGFALSDSSRHDEVRAEREPERGLVALADQVRKQRDGRHTNKETA